MNLEVEEIIKNFLEVLEELIEDYGVDPVAMALEQLLPGFEFELQPSVAGRIGSEGEMVSLEEGRGAAAMGLLRKAKNFITSKLPSGKKAAAGGAAAGGAGAAGKLGVGALGALGYYGHKSWNQDVNIDGVSTDDTLNVRSKEIEKVLIKNQELMQKLVQVMMQTQQELSKKLSDLDKSVDYMATGEDESPESVELRQDLGLSRVKKSKKKDKKEKEAKDIEKAKKLDQPTA